MSVRTVAIGDVGLAYVEAAIRDGLSLAHSAKTVLVGMSATAFVPAEASDEKAHDVNYGHLWTSDVDGVADSLGILFPDAWLAVELPLLRPDDPSILNRVTCLQVEGEEVFAVCRMSDSRETVVRTLRASDPSLLYVAVLIHGGEAKEMARSVKRQVEEGNAEIVGVLVGAYDGEGFILVSRIV